MTSLDPASPHRLGAPSAGPKTADYVAVLLTTVTAAIHLSCASSDDFFGDELYFIVCGQHPDFGYADQPPLVPLLSAGLYAISPHTWCLRLPAVISAAGVVWLTIALTRLLGGGNPAAWVAGLAAAGAPMLAGLTAVFSTSTFEPLAWTAVAYLVARAILRDDQRALVWAGAVAGFCLEAKYTVLLWLAALGAGLLLTPQRRIFVGRPFWIGLFVAGALGAPSVIWQVLHDMPFLELIQDGRTKNIALSPAAYLARLAFGMNIVLAPVWFAGAAAPFLSGRLSQMRWLASGFVLVLVATFCLHGKDYYAAGAFPCAFAAGGVALEQVFTSIIFQRAYFALAVLSAAMTLPLALPLLPPAGLLAYEATAHMAPPPQFVFERRRDLPLTFGFELGWHDFVAQVARAFDLIPPAERTQTAILVDDYGEAAAIDLYGRGYGLPFALSGHNQYFFWSLRGQNPTNIMYVHGSEAWTDGAVKPPGAVCDTTTALGTTHVKLALVFETGKAMTLCTGMKPDLARIWPSLRFMY